MRGQVVWLSAAMLAAVIFAGLVDRGGVTASEPEVGRYAIAAADNGVYRLDTATGEVIICGPWRCSVMHFVVEGE